MNKTAAVGLLAAELSLLTNVQMASAADADSQQLEEIVVVAQRRTQSVLDVPISVSVFDSALIEQKNIQSAKDYLVQTPNVTFQEGGRNGAREIVIAIRGISDIKGGEKIAIQSAFATYFDEFSLGNLATGQANPPVYDVQSIEVLRGPQGTFFGRNAEGGAINITSKKPEPGHYGQFDFGAGDHGSYELSGVVNVPVSETLFARATMQSMTTDGLIENKGPAGGDSGSDFYAVRGQLRWVPTEATTVDLSINYIIDQQDYTPKLATCLNPTFGFDPFAAEVSGGIGCYDPDGVLAQRIASGEITPPPGVTIRDNKDSTYQNTREFTDNTTSIAIARLEHDFGGISLTSITGRVASDSDQQLDLDHSGVDSVDRTGIFDADSWSQELRLATTGVHTIDWTLGALYYEDESRNENKIHIKGFLGPWMRGDLANENVIHAARDGWAAFANAEWHMSQQWSLIAGVRYSEDNDEQRWTDVYAACGRREVGAPLDAGCELRPEHVTNPEVQVDENGTFFTNGGRTAQTAGTFGQNQSTDVSPRLAINWKPTDEASMYASVAKGYKSGGVRLNPDSGFDHASLYDPEELWNYEIGFNAWFYERHLALRGSVFYMDWTDMQVELREQFCRVDRPGQPPILIPIDEFVGPGCLIVPFDSTVNAEKATSKGVELSADALLGNWTLSASVGYLDAKFEEFVTAVRGTESDLAGEQLGDAPEWTASAAVEYRNEIGAAEGFVRMDAAYRSETALDIVQRASNNWPSAVPSFTVTNLQLGAEWDRQRIALVVSNLLDEEYYTAADGFSYIGTMLDYHPRTWFVKWTWRTE